MSKYQLDKIELEQSEMSLLIQSLGYYGLHTNKKQVIEIIIKLLTKLEKVIV